MSLAGLAIAIGDVADMALIMTENIYRRLSENDGSKSHYQCVEEGAFEVGRAIITAVSNTIVSFIPVFALSDQEGKLFGPLAYTKTFAITASAILSITVVPTLAYHLLKPIRWSRRKSLVVGSLAAAVMAGISWRGVPDVLPGPPVARGPRLFDFRSDRRDDAAAGLPDWQGAASAGGEESRVPRHPGRLRARAALGLGP